MFELVINYFNLGGSFVLAISGAIVAMDKKFDAFGVFIIAFVTAVGGGTLRDMLLTEREVFWLQESLTIYCIIAGATLAIIFKSKKGIMEKPILLFDAIGLGLFTITGVQIGLDYGMSSMNCIILGTITGSFGGVIRDTLVNEIPIIFRQEIYATVSVLGGALYLLLDYLSIPKPWPQLFTLIVIVLLRLIVIRYKISLPSLYK